MRDRILFAMLGLASWAGSALAYDLASVKAIEQQLQHGVDHARVADVLEARAGFQTLAEQEPRVPWWPYWVAVADWRAAGLLLHGPNADRIQARRHCDAGIAAAERAVGLDPGLGEALAVKAALLGVSTTFLDPSALMTVGSEIEGDLGRAIGLAPDDPRVSLLDGINTLHKPSFVGGGARPAIGKLKRAIEQFDTDPSQDPAAPAWGKDDACLWAGRASMQLKDYRAARGYFAAALAANPENGWVRSTLLPEAERALPKDTTVTRKP